MKEKSILAYFKTPEQAKKAIKQLESLGVVQSDIDRFSKYPGEGYQEFTNPITGKIPSLAKMTLDSDVGGHNAGILAASDVSASGLSDGGQGGPTGHDILLTVVVDEEKFHQALDIVQSSGAKL